MKIQKIYLLLMALFLNGVMLSAQENKLILIESNILQNGKKERNSRQVFEYNEQNQLVFEGLFAWFLFADSYSKIESTMVRYNSDGIPEQKLEQEFNGSELEERTKITDYIYFDNGCLAEEEIRLIQAPGRIIDRRRLFYNEQSCQLDSMLRYAGVNTGWKVSQKQIFEYTDSGYIERYYFHVDHIWILTSTTEVIENEHGDPVRITVNTTNGNDHKWTFEYDAFGNLLVEKYFVTLSGQDVFVIKKIEEYVYEYNEQNQVTLENKSYTSYNQVTGEVFTNQEETTTFDYYCDGLLKSRTEKRGENQFFEYQYFYQEGINCDNLANFEIALYPNPAEDFLTISSEALLQNDSQIRVFDVRGALLFKELVPERTAVYDLPVGQLPAGVYFVQIGELPAKRFVKG